MGLRTWQTLTDNQQVEGILGGDSVLEDVKVRPACVRIRRQLYNLLGNRYRPRTDTTNFIEWDGRELNTYADHVANCALDRNGAWEWEHTEALERARCNRSNLRLFVDRARRGNGQSSAGMAILAYHGMGNSTRELLFRVGICIGSLESSFMAEVLAMEWALQSFFKNFVEKLEAI